MLPLHHRPVKIRTERARHPQAASIRQMVRAGKISRRRSAKTSVPSWLQRLLAFPEVLWMHALGGFTNGQTIRGLVPGDTLARSEGRGTGARRVIRRKPGQTKHFEREPDDPSAAMGTPEPRLSLGRAQRPRWRPSWTAPKGGSIGSPPGQIPVADPHPSPLTPHPPPPTPSRFLFQYVAESSTSSTSKSTRSLHAATH